MQSKIYKWENGRVVEVNNAKDAAIRRQAQEIEKSYIRERQRADKEKK